MRNRRRIAQALVILGSVALFASAALHGTFGYQGIFGALRGINADPSVLGGMKAVWLIVSLHWLVFGILALGASFGQRVPRKDVLAICGVAVLADAVAAFAGVGLFIGDELLAAAGVSILAAAVLLPSARPST